MPHVLYDHQIFLNQEYGGISRYFHELALRVNGDLKFSATVVAPLYINRYLNAQKSNVVGMRVRVPNASGTRKLLSAVNRIGSVAYSIASSADIVHRTYYGNSLQGSRRPSVITVYDMIHEKMSGHFSVSDPTSRLKQAAVAKADRIICISEHTRRDLIEIFDVNPAKTSTIHLGFDVKINTGLAPQRHSLGCKPYFLYVGERGGYKNFKSLVEAYAASAVLRRETELVAFGGGAFSSAEVQFMENNGLKIGQHVRYLSGSDSQLAQSYRDALAFVYPSLYEGFGIPPLEAMSLDCPVACSNSSSIPEVVGDAGALFEPNDPGSIREVLESLFHSQEHREKLIAAGRERRLNFSWDRCAKETMSLYRELVS